MRHIAAANGVELPAHEPEDWIPSRRSAPPAARKPRMTPEEIADTVHRALGTR